MNTQDTAHTVFTVFRFMKKQEVCCQFANGSPRYIVNKQKTTAAHE